MKNAILTLFIVVSIGIANAVPFDRLKFDQNIDTNAIGSIQSRVDEHGGNKTIVIQPQSGNSMSVNQANGITMEIHEDQEILFKVTPSDPMMENQFEPLTRIRVNGKSLLDFINEAVDARNAYNDRTATTNTVRDLVYNPLWGKKLAVIGDSLTCTPTKETSYPYYIAQRNNMTLVHNGRSGERLCTDRSETNPSTISSYTNDIPSDADFILVQIGANDQNVSWAEVEGWNVDDTDMTTNTFKGCWNLLLIGLKTHYPNAKLGIILANNWTENLGKKTEDTLQQEGNGTRRQLTQWQKIQCQKLNIPVIDPVEDTRMFTFHYVAREAQSTDNVDELASLDWYDRTKRQIETDHAWYKDTVGAYIFQTQYMRDTQHTTENGNLLLSFFYEQWMKTVLMAN